MTRSITCITTLLVFTLLSVLSESALGQLPQRPSSIGRGDKVTDFRSPGVHTLQLRVTRTRDSNAQKTFTSTCGYRREYLGRLLGAVGWGQHEIGWLGDACGAFVYEKAIDFDAGLLNSVPHKTINRAILRYTETEATGCNMLLEGYDEYRCWQSGEGRPEPKPNGCAVVLVPSVDWITRGVPEGPLPAVEGAQRIGAQQWDVTTPMSWQLVPSSIPLGASRGYGLLLIGGATIQRLTAQDNTICLSQLSNIVLDVTYTVPVIKPLPKIN